MGTKMKGYYGSFADCTYYIVVARQSSAAATNLAPDGEPLTAAGRRRLAKEIAEALRKRPARRQ